MEIKTTKSKIVYLKEIIFDVKEHENIKLVLPRGVYPEQIQMEVYNDKN